MKENSQLKERITEAETAKEAMMRLVWQHLETIDKIEVESKGLRMQIT